MSIVEGIAEQSRPYLRDGFLLCGDDQWVARWTNSRLTGGDGKDAEGARYHAVGIVDKRGEIIVGIVFNAMRQIFPAKDCGVEVETDADGWWWDACSGLWRRPHVEVELAVFVDDIRAARPANFRAFFRYAFGECGYGILIASIHDRNDRAIRNALDLGFRRIGEIPKPRYVTEAGGGEAINTYGLMPGWINSIIMTPDQIEEMLMTASKKPASTTPAKDNPNAAPTADIAERNQRRGASEMARQEMAASDQATGALGGAAAPAAATGTGSIG